MDIEVANEVESTLRSSRRLERKNSITAEGDCCRCLKTVVLVEKLKVDRFVFHMSCFTCEQCGEKLEMDNYQIFDEVHFACMKCYLNMTKATRVSQVLTSPRSASEDQLKCTKCKKRLFPVEKVTANGKPYHRTCFSCQTCKAALNESEFHVYEDNFYCTLDYLKFVRKSSRSATVESSSPPKKPGSTSNLAKVEVIPDENHARRAPLARLETPAASESESESKGTIQNLPESLDKHVEFDIQTLEKAEANQKTQLLSPTDNGTEETNDRTKKKHPLTPNLSYLGKMLQDTSIAEGESEDVSETTAERIIEMQEHIEKEIAREISIERRASMQLNDPTIQNEDTRTALAEALDAAETRSASKESSKDQEREDSDESKREEAAPIPTIALPDSESKDGDPSGDPSQQDAPATPSSALETAETKKEEQQEEAKAEVKQSIEKSSKKERSSKSSKKKSSSSKHKSKKSSKSGDSHGTEKKSSSSEKKRKHSLASRLRRKESRAKDADSEITTDDNSTSVLEKAEKSKRRSRSKSKGSKDELEASDDISKVDSSESRKKSRSRSNSKSKSKDNLKSSQLKKKEKKLESRREKVDGGKFDTPTSATPEKEKKGRGRRLFGRSKSKKSMLKQAQSEIVRTDHQESEEENSTSNLTSTPSTSTLSGLKKKFTQSKKNLSELLRSPDKEGKEEKDESRKDAGGIKGMLTRKRSAKQVRDIDEREGKTTQNEMVEEKPRKEKRKEPVVVKSREELLDDLMTPVPIPIPPPVYGEPDTPIKPMESLPIDPCAEMEFVDDEPSQASMSREPLLPPKSSSIDSKEALEERRIRHKQANSTEDEHELEIRKILKKGFLKENHVRMGAIIVDLHTFTVLSDIFANHSRMVSLTAVYDSFSTNLDRVTSRFGQELWNTKICEKPAEVINGEVDWVTIGSASGHGEIVSSALSSGKNVICKLIHFSSVEESMKMHSIFMESKNILLTGGLAARNLPVIATACDILRKGALGKVISVGLNLLLTAEDSALLAQREREQMAWHEFYKNYLDMLSLIAGSLPLRLSTMTSSDSKIMRDEMVMIEYENGVQGSLHMNTSSLLQVGTVSVCGEMGTLEVNLVSGELKLGSFIEKDDGTNEIVIETIEHVPSSLVDPNGDCVFMEMISEQMIEKTIEEAELVKQRQTNIRFNLAADLLFLSLEQARLRRGLISFPKYPYKNPYTEFYL